MSNDDFFLVEFSDLEAFGFFYNVFVFLVYKRKLFFGFWTFRDLVAIF